MQPFLLNMNNFFLINVFNKKCSENENIFQIACTYVKITF